MMTLCPRQAATVTLIKLTTVAMVLSACGTMQSYGDGPPARKIDVASIHDPVPKIEPRSQYGNPGSYVVQGKKYVVLRSSSGYVARGIASWYGTKFHGRRTSSNEPYDMYAMTAAHKTLPLPTYAEITNLDNGRKVIVRINDRGPFRNNRLIDLSYAAAVKLDMTKTGTAPVELRAIDPRTIKRVTAVSKKSAATIGKKARLYLQIGSYNDRDNAERMRQRIHHLVHRKGEVHARGRDRGSVFQVRVGPLPNVKEADRMGAKLVLMGFETPRIIID